MFLLVSGLDDIRAHDGFAIAITGMVIVFSALVLISLALSALPGLLAILNDYYPEKPEHKTSVSPPASSEGDHNIAAAAAWAMHIHRGGSH